MMLQGLRLYSVVIQVLFKLYANPPLKKYKNVIKQCNYAVTY